MVDPDYRYSVGQDVEYLPSTHRHEYTYYIIGRSNGKYIVAENTGMIINTLCGVSETDLAPLGTGKHKA